MVVNHVQNDADAHSVGAIDEATEIIRRAVQPGRREQIDTVIAPAKAAGELGDGHDFEHGDAERRQFLQFTLGGLPGPLTRKRANMQLIKNLSLAVDALPVCVRPAEAGRIDRLGRPVRSFRLKTGSRIRAQLLLASLVAAAELEAIVGARSSLFRKAGEVAMFLALEVDSCFACSLQDNVNVPAARRPYAKMDAALR